MTTTFEPAPAPVRPPVENVPKPSSTPSRVRRASERADNLMFVAVVVSALALLAGIFGVGLGYRAIDEARSRSDGGSAGGAPGTASVRLSEFTITPASLEIASGGTLDVHNDGAVPHNLAIEGTDLITPMLNGGQTARLTLDGLAPGTYTVICHVVGHDSAGMRGTLVVRAGAASAAGPVDDHHATGRAGGTGTGGHMTTEQMGRGNGEVDQGVPGQDTGRRGPEPGPAGPGRRHEAVRAHVVGGEMGG